MPEQVEIYGRLARIDGVDVVLLTASEVGRVLGVSRQRVYQLMHTYEDFPRPMFVENNVGLWQRAAIDEWKARWQRKPGRPATGDGSPPEDA